MTKPVHTEQKHPLTMDSGQGMLLLYTGMFVQAVYGRGRGKAAAIKWNKMQNGLQLPSTVFRVLPKNIFFGRCFAEKEVRLTL